MRTHIPGIGTFDDGDEHYPVKAKVAPAPAPLLSPAEAIQAAKDREAQILAQFKQQKTEIISAVAPLPLKAVEPEPAPTPPAPPIVTTPAHVEPVHVEPAHVEPVHDALAQ